MAKLILSLNETSRLNPLKQSNPVIADTEQATQRPLAWVLGLVGLAALMIAVVMATHCKCPGC
jgi:hypothetical protein